MSKHAHVFLVTLLGLSSCFCYETYNYIFYIFGTVWTNRRHEKLIVYRRLMNGNSTESKSHQLRDICFQGGMDTHYERRWCRENLNKGSWQEWDVDM